MVQTTGQYFRIAALSIARLRPAITRDPYMIQYPHFCSLGVLWVSMLGSYVRSHGEVPERSNGAVSKTVVLLAGDRGFESLPLRQPDADARPSRPAERLATEQPSAGPVSETERSSERSPR